jgi:hypothetical protein
MNLWVSKDDVFDVIYHFAKISNWVDYLSDIPKARSNYEGKYQRTN